MRLFEEALVNVIVGASFLLSQEALVSVIVGASVVIPGGPHKCDCRSKCGYPRRPS